ncbi:MAG: cytochrome c biogenesis protein ResB [Hyphomicrobiaceae bacterium]
MYLAVPFGILFLNLAAALMVTPKLRSHPGLLGFHLALAILALLAAADRLLGFTGHVEMTEGTAFDPSLVAATPGLLHETTLNRVSFVQDKFEIHYAPGMKRRETVNRVRIPLNPTEWRTVTFGDDRPLVAAGYRFYTSFNKGFAPVLTFTDAGGHSTTGAIHLPSYPLNHFKQGAEWTPPGAAEPIKIWLHLPAPAYDETAEWRFDTPVNASLVVIQGDRRQELSPGDSIALPTGDLRYRGLRTWMGYKISHNPLAPWMLSAVAIGITCLGWYLAGRMLRKPWHDDHVIGAADDR